MQARAWGWTAFYAVTIGGFVWAMAYMPMMTYPFSDNDDALFVRLAESLNHGQWLGQYDNKTLSKGPFYSVVIALTDQVSMPILVAHALAYGLACMALAEALRRWLGWATAPVFLLLLLHPFNFSLGDTRPVRESIYTSLTIAAFALLIWSWRVRNSALHIRAGVAGALGVTLAAFYLTREEGPWLLPTLASAITVLALHRLTQTAGSLLARFKAPALRQDLGVLCLAVGIALCCVSAVSTKTMHNTACLTSSNSSRRNSWPRMVRYLELKPHRSSVTSQCLGKR